MYFSIAFSIFIFAYVSCVHCITFKLEPNSQKCIGNRVHPSETVTGEYHVTMHPNQIVELKVHDQDNRVFHNIGAVKEQNKFVFTASNYDTMYDVCFTSRVQHDMGGLSHEVTIVLKHGFETKSYDAFAEAAKLKPLELTLKKLEDLSQDVVLDFEYMQKRADRLRSTNESTSFRMLYFSVIGMLCLFAMGIWQIIYMRNYFKAKKLIE